MTDPYLPHESTQETPEGAAGELVVPARTAHAVPTRRWAPAVAALRSRLPELARNPAVVATVTVGTGLAATAVREVLRSRALPAQSAATPIAVSGFIVHHVHVVHHVVQQVSVVHQVNRPMLPPATWNAMGR